MLKFILYCSCLNCKQQTTYQSLSAHYRRCTQVAPITYCPYCNNVKPNKNKFCSRSCGAQNTNANFSKETREKQKESISASLAKNPVQQKVCRVSFCKICKTTIRNKHRITCSKTCHSKWASKISKNRIAEGWNPNENRGRGKESYLEKSFKQWLLDNFPNLQFYTEQPFKRLDTVKTYFADFHFPTKNLIIELDGSQHSRTINYDLERDTYITETYNVRIIRISHKEYTNKSKIDDIINLLK